MDRPPLVPQNEENHDILPLVTEIFQDTFRTNKYPENVAENLKKYAVDGDFTDYRENGVVTIEILAALEPRLEDISRVEEEIMRIHASAMIRKKENLPVLEELRLKRHELFQRLSDHAVKTYELIQRSDIYPNAIEQYLDFTYNPTLHTCKKPCPAIQVEQKSTETVGKKRRKLKEPEPDQVISPFNVQPDKIVFWNYETGETYKQKFKLRNVSGVPHNFNYYHFPKNTPFRLEMLTDSCRLAPGMCAEFLVTFQPEIYVDYTEYVRFKTVKGIDLKVPVISIRDSPRLICYVFNPLLPLNAVKKPGPGSRYFSERRRDALNFTIDCGTCLLGNYSLVTVIVKNDGQRGRFLITTENEWCFGKLDEEVCRPREITQGCFTVFPVFLEIDRDAMCQIFVMFLPEREGFFSEKLFIICDNYSHQEVELLGDCIMFSDQFLKVNMYLLESTFTYYHRLVSITLAPHQTSGFIFSVVNNSPIHFDYYWALKTATQDYNNKKKMTSDWIKILYNTQFIPSFSTTDVIVQLTSETDQEGCYYIYLSLYLKNIPVVSIPDSDTIFINKENETECRSLCTPSDENLKTDQSSSKENFTVADVHICQLEILCAVQIPPVVTTTVTTVSVEVKEAIKEALPSLRLSKSILNFGIIPKNVEASQCLTIENLTNDKVDWKLIEIHCSKDMNLCVIAESKHLSHWKGTLKKKHKRKVAYTVEAKEPVRWVSILVLFSCSSCTCQSFVMEAVCLVAYEVAKIDITIRTDNSLAILCPKEFIYVGIPTIHNVYVHNAGLLIGCFYFLKPAGQDADKIRVRFQPQSGIVQAGGTVEVKVELVAVDCGVFENIHVPCFVGDPDRLISLRILCTVSTINVHFYLPNRDRGYDRYLWPPKSDNLPTWDYTKFGEDGYWKGDEGEWRPEEPTTSAPDESLLSLIASDSVVATYPTVKTKQINVKRPAKMTFYIENLTPIPGYFTVDATNYGPAEDCIHHVLVKGRTRTVESFWEQECVSGCGIVIEPLRRFGNMVPYEVVEIDLWIYANTWGKYLEEVIVEINDLTPFCFNLIVEVVGLPVEFPFARNTTLPCPTIRFENVAYSVESITKCFTIKNVSSVAVHLTWHVFAPEDHSQLAPLNFLLEIDNDTVNLRLAPEFYGNEACGTCIQLRPFDFYLEKQSTAEMCVSISPAGFVPSYEKTHLKYSLVGFIGLTDEDKFKENYFKRNFGVDFDKAKALVLVTLELPILQVDISSDETIMDLFVNDILIECKKFPEAYLLFRNIDMSPVLFTVGIEKPFKIVEARTIPTGITDTQNLVLERHECLQVMVTCHFSWEDLMQYAEFIYKRKETEDDEREEDFTSVITKDLNIFQKGTTRQMIPFQVRLHYPHIVVKPPFLKFGQCLLYRSKKAILSIYNMTGSIARFEIFKTTNHDDFEVYPNHGDIVGSTGVNKQFEDIAVYFTPRHCKRYMETLRVATNIPHYFIDVPVTGQGSNNEKFNVD